MGDRGQAGAQPRYHAAIDLGASSGRVLLGWVEGGLIKVEEVHRFDNLQRQVNSHDCWDLEGLFDEIVTGLAKCKSEHGIEPETVGIDTWGVDFVLLDAQDKLVGDAVAYRDARTNGIFEVADQILDPAELYAKTGIQRQSFNTVFQLIALKREHPEQLEAAVRFLMVPDYLNWRLTGQQVNEYTNATTTGMVNALSCDWDTSILEAIGVPARLFTKPVKPGASLGHLLPEIAERLGYDPEVVLPATHDTGSAFLAVPARDDNSVFISSGTWSLLGVENLEPIATPAAREQNFTNEGGYLTRYRFLKNIMGLWMNQSIRREINGVDYVAGKTAHQAMLDHKVSFDELRELCRDAEPFSAIVNVDDARFLSPASMIGEIKQVCADDGQPVPETIGQVMRTVYCSLSADYAGAVAGLQALTGRTFTSINIVGGGCQDYYLNQTTADACGLPVYAGPSEGTSLGNLAVQMIFSGDFESLAEARRSIGQSFGVKKILPR